MSDNTEDIAVDRSCIGCDNCGVGSPQKCCARCGLFYYCSKDCQVQHWKQHKRVCTESKKKYDKWNEIRNNDLPDGTVNDTKEGPCAICLEEMITNAVVMPCGHAFCFSCVGKYQQSSTSKSAGLCPYCRGEIPDVMGKAMERATLYQDRAQTASDGSEEQKKYAKLTIAEFESLIELFDSEEKRKIVYLKLKARMLSMAAQPEEAVKISNEVLSLNEKHPGILDPVEVEQTKCVQAEAYIALGKWEEAGKIYKTLHNTYVQRGGYNLLVVMGLVRTKYELGKYDEAIEYSNIAIEAFRQCPGVHKYVALSQKAKGDIDEAKKTMSRAILYETHWDKDNMQKNKELLQELNNM